jgi:hypothetical protein
VLRIVHFLSLYNAIFLEPVRGLINLRHHIRLPHSPDQYRY